MNTTYTQKSSTAQKTAYSKAVSLFDSSSQSEALQRKANMANNAAQRAEAPQPNNTGMPDNLKAGIESLSGFSMDDVRVHYNSSKPATVQALAYTQGTDIHVAPGQEKHLPHEAWHVAQQMAGRVSPTTNINGMPVNDNAGLEHEADVMGEKAVQCKCASARIESRKSSNFISTNQNVTQCLKIRIKKNGQQVNFINLKVLFTFLRQTPSKTFFVEEEKKATTVSSARAYLEKHPNYKIADSFASKIPINDCTNISQVFERMNNITLENLRDQIALPVSYTNADGETTTEYVVKLYQLHNLAYKHGSILVGRDEIKSGTIPDMLRRTDNSPYIWNIDISNCKNRNDLEKSINDFITYEMDKENCLTISYKEDDVTCYGVINTFAELHSMINKYSELIIDGQRFIIDTFFQMLNDTGFSFDIEAFEKLNISHCRTLEDIQIELHNAKERQKRENPEKIMEETLNKGIAYVDKSTGKISYQVVENIQKLSDLIKLNVIVRIGVDVVDMNRLNALIRRLNEKAMELKKAPQMLMNELDISLCSSFSDICDAINEFEPKKVDPSTPEPDVTHSLNLGRTGEVSCILFGFLKSRMGDSLFEEFKNALTSRKELAAPIGETGVKHEVGDVYALKILGNNGGHRVYGLLKGNRIEFYLYSKRHLNIAEAQKRLTK